MRIFTSSLFLLIATAISLSAYSVVSNPDGTPPQQYQSQRTLTLPFYEDFESYTNHNHFITTSGFTLIDDDEDGHNWFWHYDAVDNNRLIASRSYASGVALQPYNFLITPALVLPALAPDELITLRYKVAASGSNYFLEHYKVVISTTGNTSNDFPDENIVFEETLTAAQSGWNFANRLIDISDYSNNTVYIAFIHYDCTDQDRLLIDEIEVVLETTAGPAFNLVLQALPAYGGTAVDNTNAGPYTVGTQVSLSAIPQPGYNFWQWRKGNEVVSTNANFIYTMPAENVVLTALFQLAEPVVHALPFEEHFEGYTSHMEFFLTSSWTLIDFDGDGRNWQWYYDASDDNRLMTSRSWDGVALTPHNFLVTPAIILPNVPSHQSIFLDYQVAASGVTYYAEHYKVVVSTTGNSASDFTDANIVFEETLTAASSDWTFSLRNIDITQFKGNTVYIAFIHYNCSDEDRLLIDDVEVYIETTGNPTYTLNLSVSPAEGGTVSGGGIYEEGEVITITATPSPDWEFVGWTWNGNLISNQAIFNFTMPGSDVTLIAHFYSSTIEYYILSLQSNPAEGGIVTDNSGLGLYPAGYQVSVSANANTGFLFINWTLDGEVVSTQAFYEFLMPASNITLVANFEVAYYVTLIAHPAEGGSVANNSGNGPFLPGTIVSLSSSANINYAFQNWTLNGNVISYQPSFNYTVPAENTTLTANFELQTGIYSIIDNGLRIYPNPASANLMIESGKEMVGIKIYSVHGKLISSIQVNNLTNIHIDSSKLAKGIYLLELKMADGSEIIAKLIRD